jgi:hypothetical protein
VFRMSSELSQKHLKYDDRQVVGSNELESGRGVRVSEVDTKFEYRGEKLSVSIKKSTIAKSRKQ